MKKKKKMKKIYEGNLIYQRDIIDENKLRNVLRLLAPGQDISLDTPRFFSDFGFRILGLFVCLWFMKKYLRASRGWSYRPSLKGSSVGLLAQSG